MQPFTRTVEEFLKGEARTYKSAKGRYSTDGQYFYSYQMAIAWRRGHAHVEVLHDDRLPSLTTLRHAEQLCQLIGGYGTAQLTVVYDFDATRCETCGEYHKDHAYPSYGYGTRDTFRSGQDVCAYHQALREEDALEARGLVQASHLQQLAAVRDAALDYNVVTIPCKSECKRTLWIEPLARTILELPTSVPYKHKRALLKRIGRDSEFRQAVEALAAAPRALLAFAKNYAEEHLPLPRQLTLDLE